MSVYFLVKKKNDISIEDSKFNILFFMVFALLPMVMEKRMVNLGVELIYNLSKI